MKKSAMYHATKKRKLENDEYYCIQNAIKREYAKISMNKRHDLTNLICLQEELHLIENSKCEGAILRSKINWNLESDRNTAFFFNKNLIQLKN